MPPGVMTVKVSELIAKAGFKAVTLPDADREIKGAYAGDLLSWVMGRAKADDVWITIMSNINVVAVASLADVACVVLAEGVHLYEEIKQTALAKDVNIISSGMPIYETALEIGKYI